MAAAGHYPHTVQTYVTFNNSHESDIQIQRCQDISKVTVTCYLELSVDRAPVPNFINVMIGGESIGVIEMNGPSGKSQSFRYGSGNYSIFDIGSSKINLQDISKGRKSVSIIGDLLVQFEIEHNPRRSS